MSGHLELEGEVVDVQKGKFFIETTNGDIITTQLSGKMRLNKIKIVLGDKVKIKVSPYDLSNGLLISRSK